MFFAGLGALLGIVGGLLAAWDLGPPRHDRLRRAVSQGCHGRCRTALDASADGGHLRCPGLRGCGPAGAPPDVFDAVNFTVGQVTRPRVPGPPVTETWAPPVASGPPSQA